MCLVPGELNCSLLCLAPGGMQFNTTEQCGGTLQVQHGDQTEHHVCPLNLTKHFQNLLCKQLGCGDAMEDSKRTRLNHTEEVNSFPLYALIRRPTHEISIALVSKNSEEF